MPRSQSLDVSKYLQADLFQWEHRAKVCIVCCQIKMVKDFGTKPAWWININRNRLPLKISTWTDYEKILEQRCRTCEGFYLDNIKNSALFFDHLKYNLPYNFFPFFRGSNNRA